MHMTEEQFNEQFAKLYTHMDGRFDSLESGLSDKITTEIDGVHTKLDGIIGRLDDLTVEQAAIKSQLDRHERWHHQVADHVGLKLQHDA